ncbi:MAG: hypothetical protein WKG07_12945 [Hymenobacter sp.]
MLTPDAASGLLRRFGSPLYVYDAGQVRRAFLAFGRLSVHSAGLPLRDRLQQEPLPRPGAARGQARALREHAGRRARPGVATRLAGGSLYSGTNLDAADLDYLLARGIPLNLDSGGPGPGTGRPGNRGVDVELRLLVDDEDRAVRISVTAAELPEAVAAAGAAGGRIVGLHMYAGTNNRSLRRAAVDVSTGWSRPPPPCRT